MPRLVRREYRNGHYYTLDGERVIGVTTAMDDGVPKPALVNWAAETTAFAAVLRRDEWEGLSQQAAIKWLTGVRFESSDAAARRGSEIHELARRMFDGQEVDVPEEIEGHVDACLRFLEDFKVEVIWWEVPVACTRTAVPYAGTLDLIARINGVVWLLDWKSGKGVYGDVALQLAGYRYCDLANLGAKEVEMMPVDRCGVVHVRADGYRLVPVTAERPQWHAFLHAVQVAMFRDTQKDLVGEPLDPKEAA